MNKEYFDALVKDRSDSADTLEKPSMRGVKRSVVDKYSDQAHFVYELLQNADDTKATYARFKLYHDRLVFAHNGTRRFSVSDPSNEDYDRINGTLGDVNAILSIGNSTKTDQNTIGKFGVGFKAVFQYTSTPYIYDPEIRFKIERFFVPVLLENDHPERSYEETLFEFPFNHEINTSDIAFKAISERLSSLVNPILFLSSLEKIDFEFYDTAGKYNKTITKAYKFDNTLAECITLSQTINEQATERKLWLFSRIDKNSSRYSVGFYLNDENKLTPVDEFAYCFFPTKANTGLHFIIHAPFLLTDSREGIKSGDIHNNRMFDLLSQLAADSMVYLRNISIYEEYWLLDDSILNIIPIQSFNKTNIFGQTVKNSEFEPFYEKILSTFKTEKIIPTQYSYTSSDNAFWAADKSILSLFDNDSLKLLIRNDEAQWVFPSISRSNSAYRNFIDSIVNTWLDEIRILNEIHLAPEFIQSRTVEWLSEFYNWLSESHIKKSRYVKAKIFIDSKGNATAAFDQNDIQILYLPLDDEENDYPTLNKKLADNADILAFVKNIGITKPSLKNEI